MRVFVGAVVLVFFLHCMVTGKKMKTSLERTINIQNDAVLEVEPLPPDVRIGECTCKCCENPPAEQKRRNCANEVVVAVDSSACFRDHHGRMMRFLKKLVRRIGRTPNIQYGGQETRLALMQFSSDIVFPLELSSFEDYTNPSTKKGIMDGINEQLNNLQFLGEGSFLNKALNATVDHIETNPRSAQILSQISPVTPRPVVIVLTNGKSHPTVTMQDVEYSIVDLRSAGITVIPVSVTRECHGVQSDVWNEGLCPDTVILNKLAKVGRPDTSTFMEMTSLDTMADIVNILEECFPKSAPYTGPLCNNCTCSCELPVGPQGPPGPRGPKGDFVVGEDGPKGTRGPKGEDGRPGEPGVQGDKGNVGEKGFVGPKGTKGTVGPKGDKGTFGDKGGVGDKGDIGPPGRDGPRGRKGEDGQKGREGEKGMTGDKGEIGRKGEDGNKGEVGPKGVKGSKGIGEKGEPGNPGGPGRPGNPGNDGGKGMPGPKGMTGMCGKPGPAGRPGIDGIGGVDGFDGQPGPTGPQGPRGEPGSNGDKGERGDIGLSGEPGRTGLPGQRGPSGPDGKLGRKGSKGEPSNELGPPGLAGTPGQKGQKGTDGRNGFDGPEGPPGRQGPRGLSGERGPPGVYEIEVLRPIIVEIIRELLPGDCGNVPKPPCQEFGVDLAFLVDGSDSIDREDFDQTREWILLTVDALSPSSRKIPLFVYVVQYSEQSKIEVSEVISNSSDEIRDPVYDIEQMRSGTKTYSALEFVNNRVYPRMRGESMKILITMTDGDASEDRNVAAIDQAQRSYDMMVAVGVGSKVNEQELQDFSTKGKVFSVDNFSALQGIISEIVENICSGEPIEPAPPVPPPFPPQGPGCHHAVTDLAFVMDGSASVGENGFLFLKNFLTAAVSEFQNVGAEGVQIGMIQYNDIPKLELDFDECTSKEVVYNAIDDMEYLSGNTRTGQALTFCKERFDNLNQPSRPDPKRVVVVITDGRSQDDVKGPASALKREDATIFAIGVGEAEVTELEEIASTPTNQFVYNVADYTAISSIKDTLVQKICDEVDGFYKQEEEKGVEEDLLIPVGGEENPTEEEAGLDYEGGSGGIEFA